MTASASRICRSRPRAALALSQEEAQGETQALALAAPPRPRPVAPAPRHSLLPAEAAENLHVPELVLDIVEDHGQVQGSRPRGLP